jgi:hypothetical protein
LELQLGNLSWWTAPRGPLLGAPLVDPWGIPNVVPHLRDHPVGHPLEDLPWGTALLGPKLWAPLGDPHCGTRMGGPPLVAPSGDPSW